MVTAERVKSTTKRVSTLTGIRPTSEGSVPLPSELPLVVAGRTRCKLSAGAAGAPGSTTIQLNRLIEHVCQRDRSEAVLLSTAPLVAQRR